MGLETDAAGIEYVLDCGFSGAPEDAAGRTSSLDFNCDSCLNRAILVSRREERSELEKRENSSRSSRYRS